MSIMKSLQNWLSSFEGAEYTDLSDISTDLLPKESSGYALQLGGMKVKSIDILGHRTYENTYLFYLKESLSVESDRADNNDFVEQLVEWIDEQNDTDNLPKLPGRYRINSVDVINAMLFDISEDGSGIYQIAISIEFEKTERN